MSKTNLAVKYVNDTPMLFSDQQVVADMVPYKDKENIYHLPLTLESRARVQEVTGTKIPLMTSYPWPAPPHVVPYQHQRITAEFLAAHMRCWCLNGMRSGKTMAAIWAMDYLFRIGAIKRVMILAPLTILEDVWRNEMFQLIPQRSVYIANESIDDLIHAMKYHNYDIIVANFDKIKFATRSIETWDPSLVIVDEAGGFRYWNTDRTKALTKIMAPVHRGLWALTATPTPQGPTDIWPLARLIAPTRVDKKFSRFQDKVIIRNPYTHRTTVRPEATAIVQNALFPAIRYKTSDCIELPDMGYVARSCPLTPAQEKNIKELRTKAVTIVHDLETGVDQKLVAANAAVVAGKILQVLGGVVLDNKGKPNTVGADRRIGEVISIMDEIGHDKKAVLMCTYKGVQGYIQKKLTKKNLGSLLINGSKSSKERAEILERFRTDPEINILVAHPECIKFGVNLTCARHMIWYLPSYRSEDWQQGNQRIVGPKEDDQHKNTIIRLTSGGVEDRLYKRLMDQENVQEGIMSIFKAIGDLTGTNADE